MGKFILESKNTILLIIDIQERLAAAMSQKEKVVNNTLHLIELSKMLDMPIIVTEQYPKGLGPTLTEVADVIPDFDPTEKIEFSCCGSPEFNENSARFDRKQFVITGMETHVCVLQTALNLIEGGFQVHIVADAVCSRNKEDWKRGLQFMRDAGAVISATEIVLFQLLRIAGTEEFKAISRRIK